MKTKLSRLSIAALIAATLLISPFASYAGEEIPSTEPVTAEETGEVEIEDTGAYAEKTAVTSKEEADIPAETPSDQNTAADKTEEVPSSAMPEVISQDEHAAKVTAETPDVAVPASKSSFEQAADILRSGGRYADLSRLGLPENNEEKLFNYFAEHGLIPDDIDTFILITENGYIVGCELGRAGELPEDEEETDEPASREEPSEAEPFVSEVISPAEAADAEAHAMTLCIRADNPPIPEENGAEHPTGSLMAIFVLLAGCIRNIIQYFLI